MTAARGLGSLAALDTAAGSVQFHRIARASELGLGAVDRLPGSLKVLLEGSLRQADAGHATEADVAALGRMAPLGGAGAVGVVPSRSLDPAGLHRHPGADRPGRHAHQPAPPRRRPCRGRSGRADRPGDGPFAYRWTWPAHRMHSRSTSRWSTSATPSVTGSHGGPSRPSRTCGLCRPARGIVHQVNMEFLASVVAVDDSRGGPVARPDTLVGTDSHTTMINAMGVLGWGVGGIEAEAVMLGEPIDVVVPDVVGVRLAGAPRPGATGTDLVLAITQMLRAFGVVGRLRGVLRLRSGQPPADRQGDHRQHGARVRRHHRLLRGRRRDAALPAPDRPPAGPHRSGRAVLPRPGHVPDRRVARAALQQSARHRPRRHRAGRGRASPPSPDSDSAGSSHLVPRGAVRAPRAGCPARPDRCPARRRRGHRGHHQLHQHLQPRSDDRRGPSGPQRGRAGSHRAGPRQDQPRSRLAGRG